MHASHLQSMLIEAERTKDRSAWPVRLHTFIRLDPTRWIRVSSYSKHREASARLLESTMRNMDLQMQITQHYSSYHDQDRLRFSSSHACNLDSSKRREPSFGTIRRSAGTQNIEANGGTTPNGFHSTFLESFHGCPRLEYSRGDDQQSSLHDMGETCYESWRLGETEFHKNQRASESCGFVVSDPQVAFVANLISSLELSLRYTL